MSLCVKYVVENCMCVIHVWLLGAVVIRLCLIMIVLQIVSFDNTMFDNGMRHNSICDMCSVIIVCFR